MTDQEIVFHHRKAFVDVFSAVHDSWITYCHQCDEWIDKLKAAQDDLGASSLLDTLARATVVMADVSFRLNECFYASVESAEKLNRRYKTPVPIRPQIKVWSN